MASVISGRAVPDWADSMHPFRDPPARHKLRGIEKHRRVSELAACVLPQAELARRWGVSRQAVFDFALKHAVEVEQARQRQGTVLMRTCYVRKAREFAGQRGQPLQLRLTQGRSPHAGSPLAV